MEFLNPKSVTIVEHRWQVNIKIVDAKGEEHEFVASAHAFYTGQNNIWFSTRKEQEAFYQEQK
jgi:hypothetical protein